MTEHTASIMNMTGMKGNIYDLFIGLHRNFLYGRKHPAIDLQIIMEKWYDYLKVEDVQPIRIDVERIEYLENKYFDLMHKIVTVLIQDKLSEGEFYKKLHSLVFHSTLFPKNPEEQGVLLCMLATRMKELPYHQTGKKRGMSEEEYINRAQDLRPEIIKAFSILERKDIPKTEESALLLELLDSMEQKEDKTVILTAVIEALRDKPVLE